VIGEALGADRAGEFAAVTGPRTDGSASAEPKNLLADDYAVSRMLRLRDRSGAWIERVARPWWVLHTRARNEKRVAAALEQHGLLHYLPLARVEHAYAKRRATFLVPLFPGYVFLCGDAAACEAARRTNRVAAVLEIPDQPRFRRELVQVFRVVERGQALELYPALQEGQRCRVTAGPLRGLEGVVIRLAQRCRLFLSVSTLGQSAVVEVNAALLEPV
jgi:transcription antitermination factor NusG